jgi:CRISPR-associated protein Csm4
MQLYRTILTLGSASATPWQADTVFGHLCWWLVRREGLGALAAFLTLYEKPTDIPPILLSDGFPGDYLPRPIVPPSGLAANVSKLERIAFRRAAKQTAQVAWLTLEEFNRFRRGASVVPSLVQGDLEHMTRLHVTPKNQIDRRTDTAGGEAGELYDMEEFVMPKVAIYWRIASDYAEMVRDFLADLQAAGYGKRKSIGYGQVESFSLDEFTGFTDVSDADGFVTLCRFVPAPSDPTDGFWDTTVKYGKLGEEWAVAGNPFKRPLVQLACGSCFRDAPAREWYGQLVSGLSERPEVKHYGFALALPMRLPAPGMTADVV